MWERGLLAVLASALRWRQTKFMKAMSEDQIMQVMSDAFVANYAGASMSAISSLASMLSQRPASVGRKRKKNQLHRELSAAAFISHKYVLLYSLNEYRLKARNCLQFKAHKTNHVVLCFMLQ